ncbi:MAG: helix-turn-helix transcriptional regulator [Candidatus Cryptobacteroides sp.]|nr:helix-turn-helix transcriptional regulator [Candidatus Cryptobacteroides sp.]
MSLREVIKARRKVLGISQQDLAEMSGISLPTVKDIERGLANPSLSTISKLLDVLGMEIVYRVRQKI